MCVLKRRVKVNILESECTQILGQVVVELRGYDGYNLCAVQTFLFKLLPRLRKPKYCPRQSRVYSQLKPLHPGTTEILRIQDPCCVKLVQLEGKLKCAENREKIFGGGSN